MPPGPVPAADAVAGEELAPAGARQRQDVLDVRHGSADRADHRRVERPSRRGEQGEAREAAQRLEAPRGHVLVRHGVAGRMRGEPEQERPAAGAGERPDEPAGGDVERDDHHRRIAPGAFV